MKKYLTRESWEKNANNGLKMWTDLDKMAAHIHDVEQAHGEVTLFELTQVKYEVYAHRVTIQIYGEQDD